MNKKKFIIDGYFIEGKSNLTEDEIFILKFWVKHLNQIELFTVIPISKRYYIDLIQKHSMIIIVCPY